MSDDVWEIYHFVGEGRYELQQVINWKKTKNWNGVPCPSQYFEKFNMKEIECMKSVVDSIYNFIDEHFYIKQNFDWYSGLFGKETKK